MKDKQKILKVLRSVPNWDVDDEKDGILLDNIVKQYPKINMLEEARAWQVWMLDFKSKKTVNHRSRFRNWCKKATEFKEQDGKSKSGYRQTGRSHRNAEKEGHGESVRLTESW
tara:strand:- start:764 stop:1102 length:339 start_codon:yes stop_codon:yes gene_type:complete